MATVIAVCNLGCLCCPIGVWIWQVANPYAPLQHKYFKKSSSHCKSETIFGTYREFMRPCGFTHACWRGIRCLFVNVTHTIQTVPGYECNRWTITYVTATFHDYFHVLFIHCTPVAIGPAESTDMECKGNGITTLENLCFYFPPTSVNTRHLIWVGN